jgi:hypothetical protein
MTDACDPVPVSLSLSLSVVSDEESLSRGTVDSMGYTSDLHAS